MTYSVHNLIFFQAETLAQFPCIDTRRVMGYLSGLGKGTERTCSQFGQTVQLSGVNITTYSVRRRRSSSAALAQMFYELINDFELPERDQTLKICSPNNGIKGDGKKPPRLMPGVRRN